MKAAKYIKRLIIRLIIITIILLGSFLFYSSINDFRPEEVIDIPFYQQSNDTLFTDSTYTLFSWNIGYCGLGKEMDFFYDGGEQVRAEKDKYLEWKEGVYAEVQAASDIDFIFLQEVDVSSKRSYLENQRDEFLALMKDHIPVYADNYRVNVVPAPLLDPLGKVHSGMMTFSRPTPRSATRYAYPNIASWPNKLFLLDRCFIEIRHQLNNGKELVLMNTHNSYYVDDPEARKKELDILKAHIEKEYSKGNYIIVGGDWNHFPPGFLENNSITEPLQENILTLPNDYFPGYLSFHYDGSVPSNRALDRDYVKGETTVSVLDFFAVTDNVEVTKVEGLSLGFEHADHNPVVMSFRLRY